MYGHSTVRSLPSYGSSYSSIHHAPGYANHVITRSNGYVSGSPNGYYRHRYQYPYGNSYFFGYNSPFGLLGYGGYGYGNGYPFYFYQPNCAWGAPSTNSYVSMTNGYPATPPTAPPAADQANATVSSFAVQGEIDFKAGNYTAAESDWRHALVDEPNNGAYVMLLAQALFANGHFDEAAGALQRGMQMLPTEKWGAVVSNYAELYRGNQDYTDQLRRLEAARLSTSSAGLQLLLGYHYGYLGYPKNALTELDKGLKLAPQDQAMQKMRDVMAAR
jgi:tetratricopeptide (TPR) repeat protein